MDPPPLVPSDSSPLTHSRIIISGAKLIYDAESLRVQAMNEAVHSSASELKKLQKEYDVLKNKYSRELEEKGGELKRRTGNGGNCQVKPAKSIYKLDPDDPHGIDRSLKTLVCFPFNPGMEVPDNFPKGAFINKASMTYYLDRIITCAEYSTAGVFYPLATLLYHSQNAFAYSTISAYSPLYGVPPPRWGSEGLVMLCNDAGQATIASYAESVGNSLRTKLRRFPLFSDYKETTQASPSMSRSELDKAAFEYMSRLLALEEEVDAYREDVTHLIAAKKVLIHGAQARIYQRFHEAESRYIWLALLIVFLSALSTFDVAWGIQAKAVVGGFCGGAGSGLGSIVKGMNTTDTLDGHEATILPCAGFHGNITGENGVDEEHPTAGFYYEACQKAEAEIWYNYLTDPVLMDCYWENVWGYKDSHSGMFFKYKYKVTDCSNKVDTWDEAIGRGMPDHWDVGIRTEEGESYPDFPMVVHTSVKHAGRTYSRVPIRASDYETCLVSAEELGKNESEYWEVEYLKPKASGGCPGPEAGKGSVKEYASELSAEYDRLGSDGLNVWVRDILIREHGKHSGGKGDFTVLDIGSGLGGTLYSIAAKGMGLNKHVTKQMEEEGTAAGGGGFWGGGTTTKARVRYHGITLSGAEVLMSTKEASRRDLVYPDVRFSQLSFDNPKLSNLTSTPFTFAVAIESLSLSYNLTHTLENIRRSMSPGSLMVVIDLASKPKGTDNLFEVDSLNRPPLYQHSSYRPKLDVNDWSKRTSAKSEPSKSRYKYDPVQRYVEYKREHGGMRSEEEWIRSFEDGGWVVERVTDMGTLLEVVKGHEEEELGDRWGKRGTYEGWDSLGRRVRREKFFPSSFADFWDMVGRKFYAIKFRCVKICNRIFMKAEGTLGRELELGRRSVFIKDMVEVGYGNGDLEKERDAILRRGNTKRNPDVEDKEVPISKSLFDGYVQAVKFAPTYSQQLSEVWEDVNYEEQRLLKGAMENLDVEMLAFVVRA